MDQLQKYPRVFRAFFHYRPHIGFIYFVKRRFPSSTLLKKFLPFFFHLRQSLFVMVSCCFPIITLVFVPIRDSLVSLHYISNRIGISYELQLRCLHLLCKFNNVQDSFGFSRCRVIIPILISHHCGNGFSISISDPSS